MSDKYRLGLSRLSNLTIYPVGTRLSPFSWAMAHFSYLGFSPTILGLSPLTCAGPLAQCTTTQFSCSHVRISETTAPLSWYLFGPVMYGIFLSTISRSPPCLPTYKTSVTIPESPFRSSVPLHYTQSPSSIVSVAAVHRSSPARLQAISHICPACLFYDPPEHPADTGPVICRCWEVSLVPLVTLTRATTEVHHFFSDVFFPICELKA